MAREPRRGTMRQWRGGLARAVPALALAAVFACGSGGDSALERPYALRIDSIGVDAAVVAIESTESRVLEPPDDATLAGWWSQGAAPGAEVGAAIIVGHSASRGGGVFDAMVELAPGDVIEIDGETRTLTYRVESVEVLSKDVLSAEAERIFDQQGSSRLVLVSCEEWDGRAWQSNVIATAVAA